MREIKFRHRHKNSKGVIYITYFTIEGLESGAFAQTKSDIILSRDQYTGLKDKNGVEDYYVNDLFDYGDGRIGRVVFYERSYCGSIWNPLKKEWTESNFWINPSCYPKIGNIYENPELLND